MDPSLGVGPDDTAVGSPTGSNEQWQTEHLDRFLSTSVSVSQSHFPQRSQVKALSSKQACLSDLPHDLLLRIFSICDARTAGRLRQCSRGLMELSNYLVVWLEILKRTCTDLCLPVPSFPQKKVSSSDVELLATAWIRFQCLLRGAKDGKPPPHRIIRLIDIEGPVHFFRQSSDGRFLFVLSSTGIQVWDLQMAKPTKVCSFGMDIPDDCWAWLSINVETDNSFFVYLLIIAQSENLNKWVAFRFTLPSQEPEEAQFHFLSQLDRMPFSAQRWYSWTTIPTSPIMVTSFKHWSEGKYYIIWDPVSGTCARWAADGTDASVNPVIFIVGEFVIAYDEVSQDMDVYTQPEIPPNISYAPTTFAKLNNPALLHLPAENVVNRQKVSTMYWRTYPSRGRRVSDHDGFVSIYDTGEENWLVERVEISRENSSSASSTFDSLPLKCERSLSRPIPSLEVDEESAGNADVCVDLSLLLHTISKDCTKVVFHLSSSDQDHGGVELGRGIIYDSGGAFAISKTDHSLCPFVGRMSVKTPAGIEVVDFVELPYL
ncbi:hypothetical protein DL96DRAFT_1609645 [Flagelloscypha sp. PMI_526]|nr:hypothetical protein DL96DRAFT_1609645 [Flagelloscypha sp. PMI_526]